MAEPIVQLAFDAPARPAVSLARIQVVEKVLGEFAKQVMDIRHSYFDRVLADHDAIAQIEKAAEECGRIFLGQNPDFEPAAWNTPGRMNGLFRALADEAEVIKRPDAPATAFFLSAAKVVVAGCEQIEDRIRPDADVNTDLQRYFESVAARLLGA